MVWVWGFFLLLTGWLIARHLRAQNSDSPRCPSCGKEVPAGAQRCPSCRVPLQMFEVVNAGEAQAEQEIDPDSNHAVVRADVCVGCAACVPPCPVEGAIRMQGKLAVVDLTLCVGHGHCAEACPVGAIHVGAGSAQRIEVPRVGPDFQTDVPGLYVVGELGGRGLIKNAINEGKLAAECAARSLEGISRGEDRVHDVAVVGSGPSGLSAGLELHGRGLDYVVLEQGTLADTIRKYPRHKLLLAEPISVPLYGDLWIADASKEALLNAWERIIEKTGLRVHTEHGVQSISPGEVFELVTPQGTFRAHRVILAMGRRGSPRKLGVPGEDLEKVLYDIVEMEAFADRRIVVVGGGDSALESAVGLSKQPGTDVVLSYRSDSFKKAKARNVEKLEAAEADGQLEVWRESHVRDVRAKEIDIEWKGEVHTRPNDFLVVRIGGTAPYDFLRGLGVQIVKKDVPLVGSDA